MANPVVAIVGRPNVGKWMGQAFNLIDTGGIDIGDEPFVTQITEQAEIAIDEADVIVFVTSVKEGVTDADEKVARILYKTDKPVILAVNKVDNPEVRIFLKMRPKRLMILSNSVSSGVRMSANRLSLMRFWAKTA